MKRITKLFFVCFLVVLSQFVVSKNALAQICNLIGNTGSDQITNGFCAPVILTMPVNFAFNVPMDHSKVQIRYIWNDGSPPNTYNATYNATLNRYEAIGVHSYPPQ
jgi:hypothetical protein